MRAGVYYAGGGGGGALARQAPQRALQHVVLKKSSFRSR